jgi:dGTPase
MITWLYRHFASSPGKLPEDYRQICESEGPERAAADYIAGMTDRFAVHTFEECFVPKSWRVL